MLTISKVTIEEEDITVLNRNGEEYSIPKKEFKKWRKDNSPYELEHNLPRVGEYDFWDLQQDVQLDVRNYVISEVLESGIYFQRVL